MRAGDERALDVELAELALEGCIQPREIDHGRLARHLLPRIERNERAAAPPAPRA